METTTDSSTVVSIHLDEDLEHPAIYPEELIEPFVKATTEKNDLVLDVFAGNGTTGVVALHLGLRFVGYEINCDFCRLFEQRLGILNKQENTPLNHPTIHSNHVAYISNTYI